MKPISYDFKFQGNSTGYIHDRFVLTGTIVGYLVRLYQLIYMVKNLLVDLLNQ